MSIVSERRRPNILYIIPDEFRQRAMGFRGEDPVYTPNIDRLAGESLELENVFSNYPVCSPHRGMLFTGQYPCTNGVMGNCNSSTRQFFVRLPAGTRCLPDVLHDNGYTCGYVGKWHLDSPEEADAEYLEPRRADGKIWDAFTPRSRRHHFDYWFSYGCNDQHFRPHYWDNTDEPSEVREFPGVWGPFVEKDRVIRYLKNEQRERPEDKPFFLVWSPNPPHMPFEEVPQKYKDLYKDKTADELLTAKSFRGMKEPAPELTPEQQAALESNMALARSEVSDYFACVSGIDELVGEVLDALDEAGLRDDTLVIFTSDHGDLMGSHGLIRKGPWFDECLKIPYLLRLPGVFDGGKKDFLMNTPDIMPSLLGLLGLHEAIPESVEGQDLSRLMLAPAGPDAAGKEADEAFGGLAYYINAQLNMRGVRNRDYFLVVRRNSYDQEQFILYDLQEDPHLMKDIAAERPSKVKEMREKLQEWMERCGDWWLR